MYKTVVEYHEDWGQYMDHPSNAKRAFMQSLQEFVDEAAPGLSQTKRILLARELFRAVDQWAELPEPKASAFLQKTQTDILRRFGVYPSRVEVRVECHLRQSRPGSTEAISVGAKIYSSRLRKIAGKVVFEQSGAKPHIRSDILSVVAEGTGFIVHSFLEGAHLEKQNVKQAIARANRGGGVAISQVVPWFEKN